MCSWHEATDAGVQQRWRYVAPPLAYVLLVFVLGSIPQQRLPELSGIGTDKLAHGVGFLVMAVLFMRSGRQLWSALGDATLRSGAALGASVVGALLEVHELAVPGRSADLYDWLADSVGAALAALFVRTRWLVAAPREGRP